MQQLDLFEETLHKKIERLEKWMNRIQRQMLAAQQDIFILKHVQNVNYKKKMSEPGKIAQIDMFTGS